MTQTSEITFSQTSLDAMLTFAGRIAIFLSDDADLDQAARRANRLSCGAVLRFIQSKNYSKMQMGDVFSLPFPSGFAAESLDLVKLPKRPNSAQARKAGAGLGALRNNKSLLIYAGSNPRAADIAFGLMLRGYKFADYRSTEDALSVKAETQIMVRKPEKYGAENTWICAVAQGVYFTRDLVNEPANILTTTVFAARLEKLIDFGLQVQIIDEEKLTALGMRALLSVGQGSASPSKVVVMQWNGGAKDVSPLALVGKGVVFDTGGISLKPASGMEAMTMDMAGAGVVAGVMKTLAMRNAQTNVVGLVGLVENMPSGTATRPGDVVRSMKGDTIEIVNTDAEGRLVLADMLWYAQERFNPKALIDLATLTGAAIVGLGHQNAAVLSNNDALCDAFLEAARSEGEGAWRMPLGKAYDELIKSSIADMKNSGGRAAGAITAAQLLKRFVKPETPWVHVDIAGVAHNKAASTYAPKGATGWGVMSLNRLIAEKFED